MRKAKTVVAVVLSLLVLLAPFATVLGVIFMTPSQHSAIFHGELNQKVERLDSIEGPKLVVIGGSSVAFGLNSPLLEQYTGMPVVNFGLYGELGTKLMLDLSEDAIGAGDIVIVAPELSEQTLSLYFSGRPTWLALDDDPSLISRLDPDNLSTMVGAAWGFSAEKLSYLLGIKDAPNPSGIYNGYNFNAWGDYSYHDGEGNDLRTGNIMAGYGDIGTPIGSDISVYADDFIDYLNAYIARAERKGATVYYGWCPMNRVAITNGDGTLVGLAGELPHERIAGLEATLAERLDCEILGRYGTYAYAPEYFFDTNYHLNTAGAAHHTANLARDLAAARGLDDPVDTAALPRLPELPRATEEELAEIFVCGDFLLRVQVSGQAFEVVGLSEAGLAKETVVLAPTLFRGLYFERPVTAIAEGAFVGVTGVKTLVVGPIEGFSSLGPRAYMNSSVDSVYIYAAPGTFGAGSIRVGAPELMIWFADEYYEDFVVDYSWEGVFENAPDLQKPTDVPFEAWLGASPKS